MKNCEPTRSCSSSNNFGPIKNNWLGYLPALLLLAILFFTGPAQAQFAGGSGTAEDPYQVQTLQQLQLIADSVYLNKHFVQIADIDATETEHWNDGMGLNRLAWSNILFQASLMEMTL